MTRRAPFQGSDDWLAWRNGGYGASDAPVLVLGDEGEWNRLHAVKLNLIPDPEGTEAMAWGKRLEDVIARQYAEQTGEPVVRVDRPLEHPELPFVRASLDRRRRRGRVVVELKAWGYRGPEFGPDGSDQVPDRMAYQVQQQLAVTGYAQADLAVFFGASKHLAVYHLGRDQETIDELLAVETEAWAHIARGEVPPYPGPAAVRPQLRADEIVADAELAELVALHWASEQMADQAITALTTVKDQIRRRLVDVGGARGTHPAGWAFSVTYRPNRDQVRVDWPAIAAGYRARLLELGVSEAGLDLTQTTLTTTRAGARPLVVHVPKELTDAA